MSYERNSYLWDSIYAGVKCGIHILLMASQGHNKAQ